MQIRHSSFFCTAWSNAHAMWQFKNSHITITFTVHSLPSLPVYLQARNIPEICKQDLNLFPQQQLQVIPVVENKPIITKKTEDTPFGRNFSDQKGYQQRQRSGRNDDPTISIALLTRGKYFSLKINYNYGWAEKLWWRKTGRLLYICCIVRQRK